MSAVKLLPGQSHSLIVNSHPSESSNVSQLVNQLELLVQSPERIAELATVRRHLRQVLGTLLQKLQTESDLTDSRIGGTTVMKTIGTVYGSIGRIVFNDSDSVVRIDLDDNPCTPVEIVDEIESLNEDLREGRPLTTLHADCYVISSPPSDEDLDAIADAIAIRTGGRAVMSHQCPSLDDSFTTSER